MASRAVRVPLVPFLALCGYVLAGCHGRATSSAIPEARADSVPPSASGEAVAVIELFTSEGCSSCPPADALLADLAKDPRVLALSFHVDYWDQLGWPDRFSSADHTSRQRAYALSLGSRGLYTPQLVVGGTVGFVGSDRERARSEVAAALHRPAPVTLSLKATPVDASTLDIEYAASPAPAGAVLHAALLDREATTQVRAGENAGRSLRHVDVVRAFATAPLASAGSVRLRVPPGVRLQGEDLVGFAQRPAGDAGGMPVLGAARLHL